MIKNLFETICDTDFINGTYSSDYSIINERLINVQKAIEYNKLLLKDMSIWVYDNTHILGIFLFIYNLYKKHLNKRSIYESDPIK